MPDAANQVSSTGDAEPSPGHRLTALAVLGLSALCLIAYWGHWRGEFVYDDVYQIQGNGLLRSWDGTVEALGKDVWAFKGERAEAWSNYWRPGFVGWLALNYHLFGVDSPTGWHWTSWTLHFVACWLGFLLLTRAGLGTSASFAAAALFAVHPAHVESVGWISGVPDPLMSCWLLGSLLALPPTGKPSVSWRWAACLGLYALALATKEISILGLLLVLALDGSPQETRVSVGDRLARLAPFAVLAAVFIVARRLVLGAHELDLPWHLTLFDRLLSVPQLLLFYLRQTFFPIELSPSYPLRSIQASNASITDWLALAAALVAGAILLWLVVKRPRLRLGLALWLVPLLPAFNVAAFHPEQIVHDRYLYLPVLGAGALVAALLRGGFGSVQPATRRPRVAGWLTAGGATAAAVVALALIVQTQRTLPVWKTAEALWARGVAVDPESAFNRSQYGTALAAAGDLEPALAELDRSVALFASPLALTARADVLIRQGDLDGARRDLERVVAAQPTNRSAVERLALVFQQGGALTEAEDVIRRARERIPHFRCGWTTNLGVVLYLQGRKQEALAELEAVRGLAGIGSAATCQMGLFHLASLRAELGQGAQAATLYRRFLAITEGSAHATVRARRSDAERFLAAATSS